MYLPFALTVFQRIGLWTGSRIGEQYYSSICLEVEFNLDKDRLVALI